jgi:hypothetical protein
MRPECPFFCARDFQQAFALSLKISLPNNAEYKERVVTGGVTDVYIRLVRHR